MRNSYCKDKTVHVPCGSFVLTAFSSELVRQIAKSPSENGCLYRTVMHTRSKVKMKMGTVKCNMKDKKVI